MNLVIDALKAKYTAERLEAIANLQVYLSSPVGVGEHPNIVQECDKLIGIIGEAEDKLQTVVNLVNQSNTEQAQE